MQITVPVTDYIRASLLTNNGDMVMRAAGAPARYPYTQILAVSLAYNDGTSGNFNNLGNQIMISGNGGCDLAVELPHGAIVTELYAYASCGAWGGSTLDITLNWHALTAGAPTAMATTQHLATGGQTDSSITDATINNDSRKYNLDVVMTNYGGTPVSLFGIRIKYNLAVP